MSNQIQTVALGGTEEEVKALYENYNLNYHIVSYKFWFTTNHQANIEIKYQNK